MTIQTSCEIPPTYQCPPATVRVWTFAPGAQLRRGDGSYGGSELHLAVASGCGWLTADGVARRMVRPGAVLQCPPGARLAIDTDEALCLLAVSWDVEHDEDGGGRAHQPNVQVVDEAMPGGGHPKLTEADLTITARITMPRGITVEAWSIAAGGIVPCAAGTLQADRPPAADLRAPVAVQTCFLVYDGTGWVGGDAPDRHQIGVGNRVWVTAPAAVRIAADTALSVVKLSGVW